MSAASFLIVAVVAGALLAALRLERPPPPPRAAPDPRCAPIDAPPTSSGRLQHLLGTRYRLVADVALVDLVRFEDDRFGSPTDHRRLRSRTVPWVIAERGYTLVGAVRRARRVRATATAARHARRRDPRYPCAFRRRRCILDETRHARDPSESERTELR